MNKEKGRKKIKRTPKTEREKREKEQKQNITKEEGRICERHGR